MICPMNGMECYEECAWSLSGSCAVAWIGANCRANMRPWRGEKRPKAGEARRGGAGADEVLEAIRRLQER